MNGNLVQLGRQLLEIWKQLGLNQRISVVLATSVVLIGLSSLAFWSSRADYSLLYGKLDDAEAAKVISALDELKVPYKVGRGGSSILVPADKVHVMRMQLASRGIPRGEGVGFEIFDRSNFGISDFVQRANYVRAVQGELARTIGQLDEVEAARVMIVIPENRLVVENQKHPTASVFVRVRAQAQLSPSAVSSIRFLVANSVEGLQASHVSVVDNRGNVLSENNEADSIAGLTSNQLVARRNFEQYLSKKAEGMLEKVLGPDQAVVRVAAEINWDTVTKTEEKFDPDGQVVRTATVNDENTDTTNANAGGGAPGVPANANTETNTLAAGPYNSTRMRKKVTNNEYEINKTTSNMVQAAGGLKRLSAAVFIAARMEGTGADRKVVPRTPEDLQKLRRIVQSALGIQENGDQTRVDEITLEEMPFNDQPVIELTKQLEQQEQRQFWFQQGMRFLYPALAIGILFLFWRALKNTKADEIPIGVPLGSLSGNGNGNGHGTKPAEPQPRAITVEALNALIRENPANMTQAVRSWMTRGNTPG